MVKISILCVHLPLWGCFCALLHSDVMFHCEPSETNSHCFLINQRRVVRIQAPPQGERAPRTLLSKRLRDLPPPEKSALCRLLTPPESFFLLLLLFFKTPVEDPTRHCVGLAYSWRPLSLSLSLSLSLARFSFSLCPPLEWLWLL